MCGILERLVVYYNFEKVNHNKRISDKSGYENSGMMTPGGEILKYSDKDYTCNQAGRLWESFISLRADTFQAKPKAAITIAAWLKLEERSGSHSIFDTCGNTCPINHGVFLFQINDGVVRWYHKDEKQNTVFETMAHSVPKGNRSNQMFICFRFYEFFFGGRELIGWGRDCHWILRLYRYNQ